jgi:hypothetical protein
MGRRLSGFKGRSLNAIMRRVMWEGGITVLFDLGVRLDIRRNEDFEILAEGVVRHVCTVLRCLYNALDEFGIKYKEEKVSCASNPNYINVYIEVEKPLDPDCIINFYIACDRFFRRMMYRFRFQRLQNHNSDYVAVDGHMEGMLRR